MKKLKLIEAWAGFSKGTEIGVWEPGDALEIGVVDPVRGAQLVIDKLAVPVHEETEEPDEAAPANPPKTPTAKTTKKARG